MRSKLFLSLLAMVTVIAWQASAGQDKKEHENEHGWSGFDVGSWVTIETKRKTGDEASVSREKSMITAFERTDAIVSFFPEGDGKFTEKKGYTSKRGRQTYSAAGFKETIAGKETLEIGGRKLDCTIHEFTSRVDKQPSITAKIIIWRAKMIKIPYREIPQDANLAMPSDAVKVVLTFESKERGSKKYTGIVEDFAKKLKVGNRDLTCVVEKWDLEESNPKDGKAVMEARVWLCEQVPGCEVQIRANGTFMGKAVSFERNVIDFQASKKQ